MFSLLGDLPTVQLLAYCPFFTRCPGNHENVSIFWKKAEKNRPELMHEISMQCPQQSNAIERDLGTSAQFPAKIASFPCILWCLVMKKCASKRSDCPVSSWNFYLAKDHELVRALQVKCERMCSVIIIEIYIFVQTHPDVTASLWFLVRKAG